MPRYLLDRIIAGLATGCVLGSLWIAWQLIAWLWSFTAAD